MIYLLDLFCNATHPDVRNKTAELLAKMLADKLVGPKVSLGSQPAPRGIGLPSDDSRPAPPATGFCSLFPREANLVACAETWVN